MSDQPPQSGPLQLMSSLPVESSVVQADPMVLEKYPIGELTKLVENEQFRYAYLICGHLSIGRDQSLQICTREAGQDTSHRGSGRCCRHEPAALSIQPRSSYTQFLLGNSTLQSIFEEFLQRSGRVKDLTEELAIARTVLSATLQDLKSSSKRYEKQEVFRDVVVSLELIRKIAKSMADIQQAESAGITLDSVTSFLWQIQKIVEEELVDPETRIRIFDRIATECKFFEVQ